MKLLSAWYSGCSSMLMAFLLARVEGGENLPWNARKPVEVLEDRCLALDSRMSLSTNESWWYNRVKRFCTYFFWEFLYDILQPKNKSVWVASVNDIFLLNYIMLIFNVLLFLHRKNDQFFLFLSTCDGLDRWEQSLIIYEQNCRQLYESTTWWINNLNDSTKNRVDNLECNYQWSGIKQLSR